MILKKKKKLYVSFSKKKKTLQYEITPKNLKNINPPDSIYQHSHPYCCWFLPIPSINRSTKSSSGGWKLPKQRINYLKLKRKYLNGKGIYNLLQQNYFWLRLHIFLAWPYNTCTRFEFLASIVEILKPICTIKPWNKRAKDTLNG